MVIAAPLSHRRCQPQFLQILLPLISLAMLSLGVCFRPSLLIHEQTLAHHQPSTVPGAGAKSASVAGGELGARCAGLPLGMWKGRCRDENWQSSTRSIPCKCPGTARMFPQHLQHGATAPTHAPFPPHSLRGAEGARHGAPSPPALFPFLGGCRSAGAAPPPSPRAAPG